MIVDHKSDIQIVLPPVPVVKDFVYQTTRDHGSQGVHIVECVDVELYAAALAAWERVALLLTGGVQ